MDADTGGSRGARGFHGGSKAMSWVEVCLPSLSSLSLLVGMLCMGRWRRETEITARDNPPRHNPRRCEFRPAGAFRKIRPGRCRSLQLFQPPTSPSFSSFSSLSSLSLRRLISCTLGARIRWRHAAPLCSDEAGGTMFRVRQARNGESARGLGVFGPSGWSDCRCI